MKLSISNIAWDASVDEQMQQKLHELNFQGLEIAPTRIFPSSPYDALAEARTWAEALYRRYGLSIPSIQSIWYGRQEKLFGSAAEQEALIAYTKKAIDFAAAASCRNLVFGCPKNRILPNGVDANTAIDFFDNIADYAQEHNTAIGLEANPPIYGTNYINTTQEALALVHRLDKPSFKLNLDVGTMVENNESVDILVGQTSFISHVHISEPYLKPIEKRQLHKELANLLRSEKYAGFVSIEMGKVDDLTVLFDKMVYVKEIFG